MKKVKETLLRFNYKIYTIPLIILFIDQISKTIIFISLFEEMKRIIIFSFFNLTPVWNKGISFGMLSESGDIGKYTFIFIGISFGLLIPIFAEGWNKYDKLGAYFVSGGALGNSLDRIIYGKVIDFIDFHFRNIHWPAFNFADICITIGICLILFSGNLLPKDTKI